MIRSLLTKASNALANGIDAKHLRTLIGCHQTAKSLAPPYSEEQVLRATLEFYFAAMGMEERQIVANVASVFRDSHLELDERAKPPEDLGELCARTIMFERSAELRGAPLEYVEAELTRVFRLVSKLLGIPRSDFLQ